jgi:signal transduction histidine kinase
LGGEGSRREFRLIIADDGPGIAPEHRDRIFEPFFSTKPEKGSGLGLWMARGIANKYGGSIRVRSSTAEGASWTCVAVKMPSKRAFSGKMR